MPVLTLEQITTTPTATTKDEAIQEAADMLVAAGAVTADYADAMRERESSVSTYMGNLLAIPHGTNESKESILDSGLSVARYDTPIDWDGNPVSVAVGIAAKGNGHIALLSQLATVLMDPEKAEALRNVTTVDEVYALLESEDEDD